MWHTDGLDKLKPYGFPVHGCIDGCVNLFNRLYAKLIYANNRLNAKLILKDIAASTKRLCTAFVYNSQSSNGVQNIMSKLFKHYKLLTKAVWPYATLKLYTKA